MNAKATDRLPFIILLEMSKKFPEDYALQRALAERDQFCQGMRIQNMKDHQAAVDKRWMAAHSKYY